MRLFFATDLHGSSICFKKFLRARSFYGADLLILGGDLTAKGIVPVFVEGDKGQYTLFGRDFTFSGGRELGAAEEVIRNAGFYPVRIARADKHVLPERFLAERLFDLIRQHLLEWDQMAQADGSVVYLIPGNDDILEMDQLLEGCSALVNCDRRAVSVGGGWSVAGLGGSNSTPWRTAREHSEEELSAALEQLISHVRDVHRCVANIHVPPFGSGLDVCEAIDERYRVITRLGQAQMQSVGSPAVSSWIAKWQPPLALFGHVHEAAGWVRLGKTLCVNPGSEYYVGVLSGCLVDLDESGVRTFQLTRG